MEWSSPKLRPIFDGNVEFSIQSGVQSKTPAYFGLEWGLHSKNFGVPNALLISHHIPREKAALSSATVFTHGVKTSLALSLSSAIC